MRFLGGLNGPGCHKEIFWRSDRIPGTNEIGEFKGALVGYGNALRSDGL